MWSIKRCFRHGLTAALIDVSASLSSAEQSYNGVVYPDASACGMRFMFICTDNSVLGGETGLSTSDDICAVHRRKLSVAFLESGIRITYSVLLPHNDGVVHSYLAIETI